MKRLLPICIFIITILLISVSIIIAEEAKDVQGWRQAKWGMTEEEVLSAFKGEAVRRKESEIGKDEKNIHYPIYWPITIKNVNIYGNAEYEIFFTFDKKLKRLDLISIEKPGASYTKRPYNTKGVISHQDFCIIEALLINKYGKPTK